MLNALHGAVLSEFSVVQRIMLCYDKYKVR